jgi:hypothetical protein
LQGFKAADGTWRVVLDKPGQTGGQDDTALVAALRDEIQFLRSEIQARDDEIQHRDEEIRRVHILLQQTQQHQQPVKALVDRSQDWTMLWLPWWWWRLLGR